MAKSAHENAFYEAALKLVKEGGCVIREAFNQGGPVTFQTKLSDTDLLTETDQKVEKLLIEGLKKQFPDHKFIGEESASESGQKSPLSDDPTWIIDPVDGTTNFIHKFPFVCISIGLYIEKRAKIGIIYNPILDDLYTARLGLGAFKNGFPLQVSPTKKISKALVVSTIGSDRDPKMVRHFLESSEALINAGIRGHRSLGSAAMNMCYVASGSCNAYVEFGLHCWDMAAGSLIITEAGGCCIDTSGGPLDIMSRRLICGGTREVCEQIAALVTPVQMPRDDV